MFLGELHYTADSRGNLVLPEELRTALSAGLTLTRGLERCLVIYPAEAWQQLADKIHTRLQLTRAGDRALARLLFSGAVNCAPDAEGRIPLPDTLRRYAGIEGDTVIVGVYSHLELWDARRWAEVTARMEAQAAAAAIDTPYPLV